jgi:hypothetical protein
MELLYTKISCNLFGFLMYQPLTLAPGVGLEPTFYSRGVYQVYLQSPISRILNPFDGSSKIDTCSLHEHTLYLSLPQRRNTDNLN